MPARRTTASLHTQSAQRPTTMTRPAHALRLLLAFILAHLAPPPLSAQSSAEAPATAPLGEWYLVGHHMSQAALSSYRQFGLTNADISRRLPDAIAVLGVQSSSLKADELQLLQQGWDDALLGKAPALTYPPDQPKSLLPPALRGYHKFQRKKAPDAPGTTLADKAALWKKAVVKVRVKLADGTVHGSGSFIGPGLVLTNHHVIEDALSIVVELEADETIHPATLLAHQFIPDVALLRVDIKDHEILPVGRSADCRELEEVIMIGYPIFADDSATYVKGSISSTNRIFEKNDVFQLDIRASHGNSGGPVITTDGRIIGILTFGLGSSNPELIQFTYAIKTDFIRPFLETNARGQYETEE